MHLLKPAVVLAVLVVTIPASSQDLAAVAPQATRVVYEDARIRVVRLRIQPNEALPTHDRPRRVIIPLTTSVVNTTRSDGRTGPSRSIAGQAGWGEPGTRSLVNLSDPVDNIIVELKQAGVPAKPLAHPPTPGPSGYLEDRFHHWAFENQYVRVYDVRIPPGKTTDLYVDALDSVTVRISGGLVASQTRGQAWTKAERVEPGSVELSADASHPKTHRVKNDGAEEYHVVLVQMKNGADANLSVTKTDPAAYLNQALDEMQKRALRRNVVDWDSLRVQAHNKAANARLTVDTYDAIRFALANLGDHHSSFHPTPALEQLEAERKGRPVQNDNKPEGQMSPFVGRYEPDGKTLIIDGKRYALLVVPKCFPDNDKQFIAFETRIQQLIASLDSAHPEGWIVDLRGNVGGNMWPMIGGIGPILGESDNLGEFFTKSGYSVWTYREGVASEVEDTGKQAAYPRVDGTPYKMKDLPPVAVLIDNWTGSSGEAVAIALRGRPRTRFFGEHTQGASTTNEVFKLSDGASMWLTIGVDAVRTGKQYVNGFDPDEIVKGPNQPVSPENDSVVMHAVKWLDRNPS